MATMGLRPYLPSLQACPGCAQSPRAALLRALAGSQQREGSQHAAQPLRIGLLPGGPMAGHRRSTALRAWEQEKGLLTTDLYVLTAVSLAFQVAPSGLSIGSCTQGHVIPQPCSCSCAVIQAQPCTQWRQLKVESVCPGAGVRVRARLLVAAAPASAPWHSGLLPAADEHGRHQLAGGQPGGGRLSTRGVDRRVPLPAVPPTLPARR